MNKYLLEKILLLVNININSVLSVKIQSMIWEIILLVNE